MQLEALRAKFEAAGHHVSARDDVDVNALAWFIEYPVSTLRNWRSQKKGPPYIVLACGVRYPLVGIAAWLESLVRNRP